MEGTLKSDFKHLGAGLWMRFPLTRVTRFLAVLRNQGVRLSFCLVGAFISVFTWRSLLPTLLSRCPYSLRAFKSCTVPYTRYVHTAASHSHGITLIPQLCKLLRSTHIDPSQTPWCKGMGCMFRRVQTFRPTRYSPLPIPRNPASVEKTLVALVVTDHLKYVAFFLARSVKQ